MVPNLMLLLEVVILALWYTRWNLSYHFPRAADLQSMFVSPSVAMSTLDVLNASAIASTS